MFDVWRVLGVYGWIPLVVLLFAARQYPWAIGVLLWGLLWLSHSFWWSGMLAEPTWGAWTPEVIGRFVQTLLIGGGGGALMGGGVARWRWGAPTASHAWLLWGMGAATLAGVSFYTAGPEMVAIAQGRIPILSPELMPW
jgi:hypothetical protein